VLGPQTQRVHREDGQNKPPLMLFCPWSFMVTDASKSLAHRMATSPRVDVYAGREQDHIGGAGWAIVMSGILSSGAFSVSGFETLFLPVTHPGVEQKATWLQIRQNRPGGSSNAPNRAAGAALGNGHD
jgi:hypothetical protein